jgi:hypothetical protein
VSLGKCRAGRPQVGVQSENLLDQNIGFSVCKNPADLVENFVRNANQHHSKAANVAGDPLLPEAMASKSRRSGGRPNRRPSMSDMLSLQCAGLPAIGRRACDAATPAISPAPPFFPAVAMSTRIFR